MGPVAPAMLPGASTRGWPFLAQTSMVSRVFSVTPRGLRVEMRLKVQGISVMSPPKTMRIIFMMFSAWTPPPQTENRALSDRQRVA